MSTILLMLLGTCWMAFISFCISRFFRLFALSDIFFTSCNQYISIIITFECLTASWFRIRLYIYFILSVMSKSCSENRTFIIRELKNLPIKIVAYLLIRIPQHCWYSMTQFLIYLFCLAWILGPNFLNENLIFSLNLKTNIHALWFFLRFWFISSTFYLKVSKTVINLVKQTNMLTNFCFRLTTIYSSITTFLFSRKVSHFFLFTKSLHMS